MAGERAKGGKKGRKHGVTKGKPSQQRYTAERRWERNQARKKAKADKFREWCGRVRAKLGKVKDVQRQIRKLKRGEA